MREFYILDGHEIKQVEDVVTWAKWFEKADLHVANDRIDDDTIVSTVFLGLDYSFDVKLLIFETMVFGGKMDGEMERYSTWDEAVTGHNEMIKRVKEGK